MCGGSATSTVACRQHVRGICHQHSGLPPARAGDLPPAQWSATSMCRGSATSACEPSRVGHQHSGLPPARVGHHHLWGGRASWGAAVCPARERGCVRSECGVVWHVRWRGSPGPVMPWPCHALALSCLGPVMHWPCHALALSCTSPVMHWPCHALALSCTGPVMHWPCHALALSCPGPVMHWPCHALAHVLRVCPAPSSVHSASVQIAHALRLPCLYLQPAMRAIKHIVAMQAMTTCPTPTPHL